MKNIIFYLIAISTIMMMLTGCGINGKNDEEKVDDAVRLNDIKSVCEDVLVEVEEIDGISRLFYYDYKTEKEIYACSQANCNHSVANYISGKINCNAIIEGEVKYPFVYNGSLYYIICENGTSVIWKSNTDGTNKEEVITLEFELDAGCICAEKDGMLYLASHEVIDKEIDTNKYEQCGGKSEVYEINIIDRTTKQLTNFGLKAEAYCKGIYYFDGKLFIQYYCREKTYQEAGFKDVDHFLLWMESDDFSYAKQIEMLGEKQKYYIYDFSSNKAELFDIDFETNFAPYKGIEDMDGVYYLLCYKEDIVYYLDAVVGNYSIFSYNTKTKERKEIISSFKIVEKYIKGKIYITAMDMDESTKGELIPSVDINKEPRYYIYDVARDELVEQNYGKKGKIYYAIDRNDNGLLMYEVNYDLMLDFIDEHNIKEIEAGKIKE